MQLKSYFASTVEQAMRKARCELGADAMLVASHRSGPEAIHLGNYEVVFATTEEASAPPKRSTAPSTPDVTIQIQELRNELSRLAQFIGNRYPADADPSGSLLHPWAEAVHQELLQAGIDPELVSRIAAKLDVDQVAGNSDKTGDRLREAIAAYFIIGRPPLGRGRIALVGPPGAGKTLLAEKISAFFARSGHARTTILAYGGSRKVWGWSNASVSRTLDAAASPAMLEKKLMESGLRGPVLIDTPGVGMHDDPGSLAAAIGQQTALEIHLVLPAIAKTADLSAMIRRFAVFKPARIALTHLDESTSHGNLLNLAESSKLPITFLSAGQNVDEIEVATTHRLVSLVLGDSDRAEPALSHRTRSTAQSSCY
jgi:flagellar biosynthesis protein FlhF